MNGIKTEDMGSRKKFLAPIAVLIVCMLALTGAAYAYTATMTNTENNVTAQDLTIDLKGGAVSDTSIIIETGKLVTFTDHYKYAKVDSAIQKTDTVKCEVVSGRVMTYKVVISGDAPGDMVKVCAPNIATYKATYLNAGAATGTTIGDIIKIKVGFENDISTATELSANNIYVTCPSAVSKDTDIPVYVFIEAVGGAGSPATKETTVQTDGVVGGTNVLTAAQFATAFEAATFSLQFEAYKSA